MAHLQNVIIAEQRLGRGTDQDPIRMVSQIFSTDGELIGEIDPIAPQYDPCKSEWVVPSWMQTRIGALSINEKG